MPKDDNFNVHYEINQLLNFFGVPDDLAGNYAEILENSIVTPRSSEFQASASNILTKITNAVDDASQKELIRSLYHSLKSRDAENTNRYIHFIGAIISDDKVLNFVKSRTHSSETDCIILENNKQIKDVIPPFMLDEIKTTVRKEIEGLNLPRPRRWKNKRPYMTRSFRIDQHQPETFDSTVSKRSLSEQQRQVVTDLLFCFQGIQGKHVRAVERQDYGKVVFEVNPALDPHLREIAFRCLPLGTHFDTVVRFCEKRSEFCYGLVCQALCEGMEVILEEYLSFLCSLEINLKAGGLILQQLTFEIDPLLRCLEVLTEICTNIEKNDLLGGKILSFLYEKQWNYSGAIKARDLCLFLLERAAKPLFRHMLEAWLFHGIVNDPCLEFFIVDTYSEEENSEMENNGLFTKSDFDFDEKDSWEKRYLLKLELCPSFLKSVSQEILKCGKYLNVLASCGCSFDVESQFSGKLEFSFDDRKYLCVIQDACSEAGAAVLKFLLEDCGLMQKFKSMKIFFFIEQGDWLLEFLDTAWDELQKFCDDVHLHRLVRLLDEAIRTSAASCDALREEVQVELLEFSLTSFLNFVLSISGGNDLSLGNRERMMIEKERDMKGIEGFCLAWKPGWPLSLVFNQKSLLQYQIIFRRLLSCKHAEKMLCRSWLDRKKDLKTCLLRQKMVGFVQNYMYYCTVEVLEPNWAEFIERVGTAKNVDDVLKEHGKFLDTSTKDCMLTDSGLVEAMDKLLKLSLKFADSPVMKVEKVEEKFSALLDSLLESVRQLDQQHKAWMNFVFRLDLSHDVWS